MNREQGYYLRLTEDELEQIRRNAAICDRSVSAYIRESALNMCVLEFNEDRIDEHTLAITMLSNTIGDLIFTIVKTERYVPPDLEYIVERMREIQNSEKELLKLYQASHDANKAYIRECMEKIAN